ncbi:hypothetical protein B0J17DRAFT_708892 [Rhizoctonia solani]|nr:hypothetical protein B0J17DRAFT_708892 [Rhizoctonia solani]
MSPLMKGLDESYRGAPMSSPPGWGSLEDTDDEQNTILTADYPSSQPLSHMYNLLQPQPNLLPANQNTHVVTQPNATNIEHLRRQITAAMHEPIQLPSPTQAQGLAMDYEMALDGVSLERLMLGAAITAVPGVQTASAVYITVTSGAERISWSVQRATNLSKSFRGVRVGCATDENLSSGWVDVSPQDIPGAE